MHTIKVTRTGNSLDQEFEMNNPLVRHELDYFEIWDANAKSHKVYVFDLNLLMIEIIPQ